MKKKGIHKLFLGALAVAMLMQVGTPTLVKADENVSEEVVVSEAVVAEPILQDGNVILPTTYSKAQVKDALGHALVQNADQVDLQSLEWEYFCSGKKGLISNDAWGDIFGFTSSKNVGFTTFTHPALVANADKDYKIRLKGTTKEVTVNKAAQLQAALTLNPNCKVKLPYKEDLNIDFAALKEAIFTNMVAETTPELTLEDVSIKYYATATTGAVGSIGKEWVPLEGDKVRGLTYPAISEGTQKIRISYAGNDEYKSTSAEETVQVMGLPELEVTLHEAPYEVGLVFTDNQDYDYTATQRAIYEAVIDATNPEINPEDITVEYDASASSVVSIYKPLDTTDWSVKKFGEGTWKIRFSWKGTREYKAGSIVEKVTMKDNRIASEIVVNENAAFTYNMDATVMKQAIFDQVIDWTNSTLPARETLTVDNFKMEYYGNSVLPGNISGNPGWAPIEGSDSALISYPIMGAGEQTIRITYKGNAEYRPSANTEAAVTVNKAKVSVKVKSLSIYPDDSLPADMVTTNPGDKFDIYTIYAGVTRNATSIVYLELPERYTNKNVLKLLDPVAKSIYGKTFTEMLRDGMTIGELKELLNAEELIELLEKLNIDTGTFGQIIKVIDQLPSVTDSIRVAFGTPNNAGTYVVTAVTDNPNYYTGIGVGALYVKVYYKDVKLNWNQVIPNKKLTAKEAAEFDFGVTLTYKGDGSISQESVHYLYSGMTSKFRAYSSTTTPPTEPGSYIVTVVTLGGNYQAAPITRSFKITK